MDDILSFLAITFCGLVIAWALVQFAGGLIP